MKVDEVVVEDHEENSLVVNIIIIISHK